jgi:hypothetical protein
VQKNVTKNAKHRVTPHEPRMTPSLFKPKPTIAITVVVTFSPTSSNPNSKQNTKTMTTPAAARKQQGLSLLPLSDTSGFLARVEKRKKMGRKKES